MVESICSATDPLVECGIVHFLSSTCGHRRISSWSAFLLYHEAAIQRRGFRFSDVGVSITTRNVGETCYHRSGHFSSSVNSFTPKDEWEALTYVWRVFVFACETTNCEIRSHSVVGTSNTQYGDQAFHLYWASRNINVVNICLHSWNDLGTIRMALWWCIHYTVLSWLYDQLWHILSYARKKEPSKVTAR